MSHLATTTCATVRRTKDAVFEGQVNVPFPAIMINTPFVTNPLRNMASNLSLGAYSFTADTRRTSRSRQTWAPLRRSVTRSGSNLGADVRYCIFGEDERAVEVPERKRWLERGSVRGETAVALGHVDVCFPVWYRMKGLDWPAKGYSCDE